MNRGGRWFTLPGSRALRAGAYGAFIDEHRSDALRLTELLAQRAGELRQTFGQLTTGKMAPYQRAHCALALLDLGVQLRKLARELYHGGLRAEAETVLGFINAHIYAKHSGLVSFVHSPRRPAMPDWWTVDPRPALSLAPQAVQAFTDQLLALTNAPHLRTRLLSTPFGSIDAVHEQEERDWLVAYPHVRKAALQAALNTPRSDDVWTPLARAYVELNAAPGKVAGRYAADLADYVAIVRKVIVVDTPEVPPRWEFHK